MLTATAFLFFMLLLLITALLERYFERLNIPLSLVLVILGFVASELATKGLGLDIGINWDNFQPLIVHFLLPILIFQAAMMMDVQSLRKNILPILMLALPLTLLSTVFIAIGVYFGINHPSGFPWIAALLTGAILSATDSATALVLLRKYGAPQRLIIMLESESLFNDTTAVVLFSVVIAVALTGQEQNITWLHATVRFLAVFFGGIATGIMTGLIAHAIIRVYDSDYVHLLVTILAAYMAFLLANDVFELSGVMAVLAAGLIIQILNKNIQQRPSQKFVDGYWYFTATVAEKLIYLLAGVTITLSMFASQWLAILIGIGACLFARVLVIFGTFPLLNLISGSARIPRREQLLLVWGGDRGVVTLALALSLPLMLDYWYTIQSIAYGVVIFTMFVQSTSMIPVVKRYYSS